jgi:hypothetical protein
MSLGDSWSILVIGANGTAFRAPELRKLPVEAVAWHKVPKRQLVMIVD